MDLSAFHNQFREETAENVRQLTELLMLLEQQPELSETERRTHFDTIFRAIHTVKGSARMLGFGSVGHLAHAMEYALSDLRQGQHQLTSTLTDTLLQGGDALLALTTATIEGVPSTIDVDALVALFTPDVAPAPPTAEPTPLEPQAPRRDAQSPVLASGTTVSAARATQHQTVRVRVTRLDRLINLTEEITIGQQVLVNHSERLHELNLRVQQQVRALAELEETLQRLRFSPLQRQSLDTHLGNVFTASEQVQALIHRQAELVGRFTNQQGLLIKDLEQEVMTTRMVPIAALFTSLPRIVRDVTHSTIKQVTLQVQGENTELDRRILEILSDPLIHLIRNAIDHGIELPAERIAANKPPAGQINVQAQATGGDVRVTISDDGRGMDPQRLRELAVRRGVIQAEEAALLGDNEALDLIFLPGFSTTTQITDISGRGVGMDVVRTNINEVGGQVLVDSTVGQGTQIILVLPLTLVTTRIVLVHIGTTVFALPTAGCRGVVWIHRDDLQTVEGQTTIAYEGRTITAIPLAHIVGLEVRSPFEQRERVPALLIGSGKRLRAACVDRLLDECEAVVKPLGSLLEHQKTYSGAVQLGDGSLVLLLNPIQLARSSHATRQIASLPTAPRERNQAQAHLMVCDDSFTTRELVKSILVSAGYNVATAVDGQDAFDKLRTHTYDLVLSDVEMPRMNGFELTARLRQAAHLRHLPVVLMTSLAAPEDQARGYEAGAQAYVVKSQFDQDKLLHLIRQLLTHKE